MHEGQKLYERKKLLNQVLGFKDTDFIKVLTGIRRSGKSSLLQLLSKYLIEAGIARDQIVFVTLEAFANRTLRSADALYTHLSSRISGNRRHYLLIDEIQRVENWQDAINGIRVEFNCDIYITGSNAKLLSGELATLLSGRYVEIEVHPLSYAELLEMRDGETFSRYERNGGFPAVALADDGIKSTILSGIYDTVLLNDIIERSKLSNPETVSMIAQFLANNIGQLTTPTRIAATLTSKGVKTTHPTVIKVLEAFESAYLFFRANRYDMRGKQYLETNAKYYIADIGLRNEILGKFDNRGGVLENIVYLELRRRGYRVDVGKLEDREIDFVARRKNETLYVQVALELPESGRESGNLLRIGDNYQKTIITRKLSDKTEVNGIPVLQIEEWLLQS